MGVQRTPSRAGRDAGPAGPPRPPDRAAGGDRDGPAAWSSTGCWPPAIRSCPIHPNAFHAARPRWGAAGAKSDPGDSYKLADYLRTDGHRLRRLQPAGAATRELQALVRLRDDHVAAKTAASNQLAALLDAALARGQGRSSPGWPRTIALAFLTDYPTPQAAARLGEARLAALLPPALLPRRPQPRRAARNGCGPPHRTGRADPDVLAELVGAQVRLLRTLLATIADLDRPSAGRVLGHAKAKLLAPLPRVGEISLAQIVAEVGPILDRASSRRTRRRRVRRRTGHQRLRQDQRGLLPLGGQHPRPQRPHRLRPQLPPQLTLGGQALRRRPRRGKRHPHAVRILARAWLRVIWACWHTDTPYDPAKHGAEQRLAAGT